MKKVSKIMKDSNLRANRFAAILMAIAALLQIFWADALLGPFAGGLGGYWALHRNDCRLCDRFLWHLREVAQ
ncbi:MAG: hypothetical protein A2Z14_15265 [Chloroflexi bacterium RBG_16_48_8]|nr:MAG: hypothetical protein A2Z14_15265 [Chloroflexi bacterium RBG_16_48_8]